MATARAMAQSGGWGGLVDGRGNLVGEWGSLVGRQGSLVGGAIW